jgi:hypothetical protein
VDIAVYARVLWRFRFLVVLGVILALALALLSYVRVSFSDGKPVLSYRGTETWQSDSTLFVTQSGFPWGRSVTEQAQPTGDAVTVLKPPRFADADRFESLAALYAALATGDPVRRILLQEGPMNGTVSASPVLASELLNPDKQSLMRFAETLPLVRVSATSATPNGATLLAARSVEAFRTYLADKQRASDIPEAKRVLVTVLEEPGEAMLVDGRSKLYPALIAFAVIAFTLLLAFALENIRPRERRELLKHEHEAVRDAPRRTA